MADESTSNAPLIKEEEKNPKPKQTNPAPKTKKKVARDGATEIKQKIKKRTQNVKKSARVAYKAGKETSFDIQHLLEEQSDVLIKTVKENPLTSVLIAGGVGFLLSLALAKNK
ncbi:MAG: DUF883 domain-containing protein [Tatlockia sp.]|nr:DUF883 domain-containing protein [Tatlockia sp.]